WFEDVVTEYLDGGRDDLRRMSFTTFVRATVVKGLFYVAIDTDSGKVIGTACWFPPGVDLLAEWVAIQPFFIPVMFSEEQKEKSGAVNFFAILEKEEPAIHKFWMN
ncbi:hypothetical protein L218DRAFT_845344, partial [Marasmius fiardii PR-910]